MIDMASALPHRERGAAALIITVILLLAMALAVAFANRDLLFEQRSAANGVRAAQAFEAAEAGLEWATAQLNANRRIGADCTPSSDPAATSFLMRHLDIAAGTGLITPMAALPAMKAPRVVTVAAGGVRSPPIRPSATVSVAWASARVVAPGRQALAAPLQPVLVTVTTPGALLG